MHNLQIKFYLERRVELEKALREKRIETLKGMLECKLIQAFLQGKKAVRFLDYDVMDEFDDVAFIVFRELQRQYDNNDFNARLEQKDDTMILHIELNEGFIPDNIKF